MEKRIEKVKAEMAAQNEKAKAEMAAQNEKVKAEMEAKIAEVTTENEAKIAEMTAQNDVAKRVAEAKIERAVGDGCHFRRPCLFFLVLRTVFDVMLRSV